MTDQSNAGRLREAYARWNDCKGTDPEMWDAYTTEDLKLQSLAGGKYGLAFSAARDGRAEMHGYLRELTEAFRMEHWTLRETVSEGDRVVGIGTTAWTSKATGKTFETPIVVVCRFRDGCICEYHEFFDTAAVAACVG